MSKQSNAEYVPEVVLESLEIMRESKQKIVLVTGVFDVLHEEHKLFLKKAKAAGDALVVGIESDVRVRQIKGEGRPIQSQETRLQALEMLDVVDVVFILPEKFSSPDDHRKLISLIKPDIFAVSSHTAHLDKKRKIVEEFGGRVEIVHEHNPKMSTTIMLEQGALSNNQN